VGNTLEWYDVTEKRAQEVEVTRLQQAVSSASTAIMMIDRNRVITYANSATVELLRKNEPALRQVYRSFSADAIVGQCIDIFHANPAHQRRMLESPENFPYSTKIKVGPLVFKINVTAIRDGRGNYIGNTMEWSDITQQVEAERQIESLLQEATEGKLDRRIETQSWEGFFKAVGDGMNRLMDTVAQPLRQIRESVLALSEGDLTRLATGEFQGEFGVVTESLNASINHLRQLVGEIRNSSARIAEGAAQLNEGNTNLSSRTQEQASALEETSSTVEQMTSTVKQNADNARQANQLAAGARDMAEQGGDVVGRAVKAMSEINASSKKIADIISVIDEIAFQTNLLALNAAVEAARAGEQGRGFAVVASEVRNLAQRSAGAAKEIKSLIKDSVDKVQEGTKLVDQSGSTLQEIVAAVKKVSDIVAEIAAASQEQATGIEQVNKAISQMDETTQQNAALVEEAAAASSSMDEQARGLDELVGFFRSEEGGEPAPERPAPRAAAAAPPSGSRPGRPSAAPPAPPARGAKPAPTPRPAGRPPAEVNGHKGANGSSKRPGFAPRAGGPGKEGGWEEF
jgi:methyl-accepting chemotaxis protein